MLPGTFNIEELLIVAESNDDIIDSRLVGPKTSKESLTYPRLRNNGELPINALSDTTMNVAEHVQPRAIGITSKWHKLLDGTKLSTCPESKATTDASKLPIPLSKTIGPRCVKLFKIRGVATVEVPGADRVCPIVLPAIINDASEQEDP